MEGAPVLRLITAAGAACVVLVCSPAAFAATATIAGEDGAILDYRAAPGETNAVTVSAFDVTITIADSGTAITAGSGCTTLDANTVRCTASSAPASLAADLGDADDTLTVSGTLDTFAAGGAGKDSLIGGAGDDTLIGGSGGDTLTGGAGWDTLTGDGFAAAFPGDDTLDGGPDADVMRGDDGVDTADYSRRTTAVEARLDGLADDGGVEDAGGDNVATENVTTGAGDDVLVGDDAANLLRGGAGTDHLDGAGGADALQGGLGADVLLGGDADDTLDARDGAPDTVSCEAGHADTALPDGTDAVTGCEQVAPALLTEPTMAGTPIVGHELTATSGTWMAIPAPSFAYRWLLCTAPHEMCTDIAGATSAAYTPAAGDAGFTLHVDVVATNAFGTAEATSVSTAPVAAAPTSPVEPTPTTIQNSASTTTPPEPPALAADTPATSPTAAAAPPRAAAAGDERQQLILKAPRRVSAAGLRRGLAVTVHCQRGQSATLVLTAPRGDAKNLRLARSTFACLTAPRRVILRVTGNLLRRVGARVLLRFTAAGAVKTRTIAVRRAAGQLR